MRLLGSQSRTLRQLWNMVVCLHRTLILFSFRKFFSKLRGFFVCVVFFLRASFLVFCFVLFSGHKNTTKIYRNLFFLYYVCVLLAKNNKSQGFKKTIICCKQPQRLVFCAPSGYLIPGLPS